MLLLASKGPAGVAGAGFVVLAATLASVGSIPVESVALILGVHRLLSRRPHAYQPDRQWSGNHCRCQMGKCARREPVTTSTQSRDRSRRTRRARASVVTDRASLFRLYSDDWDEWIMVRTSKAGDQDAELAIIVHSAMALVVVGHRAGSALLHRQARLGDSPAPTGASETQTSPMLWM